MLGLRDDFLLDSVEVGNLQIEVFFGVNHLTLHVGYQICIKGGIVLVSVVEAVFLFSTAFLLLGNGSRSIGLQRSCELLLGSLMIGNIQRTLIFGDIGEVLRGSWSWLWLDIGEELKVGLELLQKIKVLNGNFELKGLLRRRVEGRGGFTFQILGTWEALIVEKVLFVIQEKTLLLFLLEPIGWLLGLHFWTLELLHF